METIEKTSIWDKRAMLKEHSAKVAELVEDGTYSTINDAIINEIYKDGIHCVFNTYRQWREKGFQVRKGEKAFFVWARPLDALKEQPTPEEQDGKSRFFPLCFLFSNAQVDRIETA
jgi:antirestriction protein ArdC